MTAHNCSTQYSTKQFWQCSLLPSRQSLLLSSCLLDSGDSFSAAGPRLWNSLPVALRNDSISLVLFMRQPYSNDNVFKCLFKSSIWKRCLNLSAAHCDCSFCASCIDTLTYLLTYFTTYVRSSACTGDVSGERKRLGRQWRHGGSRAAVVVRRSPSLRRHSHYNHRYLLTYLIAR